MTTEPPKDTLTLYVIYDGRAREASLAQYRKKLEEDDTKFSTCLDEIRDKEISKIHAVFQRRKINISFFENETPITRNFENCERDEFYTILQKVRGVFFLFSLQEADEKEFCRCDIDTPPPYGRFREVKSRYDIEQCFAALPRGNNNNTIERFVLEIFKNTINLEVEYSATGKVLLQFTNCNDDVYKILSNKIYYFVLEKLYGINAEFDDQIKKREEKSQRLRELRQQQKKRCTLL